MEYLLPVIDAHFHVYKWFWENGTTYADKTDAYRASRNFRAININSLPSGTRDVSNNIMCALYKLEHPDVYAHGGLVYPSYPIPETLPEGMDCKTQYEELMAIGFDGIKMLETKPDHYKQNGRRVNDPLYDAFFAKAEQDGTHFVWHVADPETFWDASTMSQDAIDRGWCYGDGTYSSKEQIYSDVFDVLERHPKLKVTFAHFFFMAFQPERLEKVFSKYPNVNVDLTPGSEMYIPFTEKGDYFRRFFLRHADRIEFGTDSSDESDGNPILSDCVVRFVTTSDEFDIYGTPVKGISLPDFAATDILSGNFLRRVGKAPRPIDKDALKAYIAKYHSLIKDANVCAAIDNRLKTL